MRYHVHLGDPGHAATRAPRRGQSRGEQALSRVLVTQGEQRSSLAVVRSLGRAGHEVWVCDSVDRPLAGASRFARGSFRVPDARDEPEAHRAAVLGFIRECGIEVLIPTTDASASVLLDLADEEPGLIVPSSGLETYRRLSDKFALTSIAPEVGIRVPGQTVLTDKSTPLPDVGAEAYPLFVKPSRSAVERGDRVQHLRVEIATDAESLQRHLDAIPQEAYPVMLQERIVGPGRGVFLLMWEGEVYAHFAHRRIREKPVTGGVSVYREGVAADPADVDRAAALLRKIGWNGVAMVEFKEREATGELFLMEVNARFWGSLQLAVDSGVDFPRLLVELATGGKPEPVREYRTGLRSRWLWGEVDHALAVARMPAETRRSLSTVPGPLRTLARLCVPWIPGDRWEVLRPGDPRPFFRETATWFRSLR